MIPAIQIEVKMLLETFELESHSIQELLRGPVIKDLTKRAIRVEAAAKSFATGVGGGPQVRTGRLRSSIGWRQGVDAISPYVDVGSAVHYAPFVEFGHRNRAHAYPIYTPGGKFTGTFGFVTDKPTPAYPFLRPAAQAARSI